MKERKKYYTASLLLLTLLLSISILQMGCKKAAPRQKDPPPNWAVDATGKYPYTMTAVVVLPGRSNTLIHSGDQLGAFLNGECRGVGILEQVGDSQVFFVLIHGDAAEQQKVVFQYYNSTSSTLYYSRNEVQFTIDAIFGTVDEPEILMLTRY